MLINYLMILLIAIIVLLLSLVLLLLLSASSASVSRTKNNTLNPPLNPQSNRYKYHYLNHIHFLDNFDLSPRQKMFTKFTLIIILILIFIAVILSNIIKILDTNNDSNVKFELNQNQDDKHSNDSIVIDDKYDGQLLWFIHLSDTHLSYYRDESRKSDLIEFCQTIMPVIAPKLLVLTGDITDARTKFLLGSEQYHDEWIMYRDVREQCMKANPKLIWLDIKGNHDTFNTYNDYNNFNNYIVQSNMSDDGRSYRYEYVAGDGAKYSFIAADACLKPGVRRPFNFVGQFEPKELEKLRQFRLDSRNSTYTVWYGHYPTSSIFNREEFRQIINGPYLCGHYHTIHGLVPNMITTQPEGYLEAETGDWKDYRIYRIVAIDHGLFTFANYYYRPHRPLQPLIVITNPRSIQHQMENIEPFWRAAKSTHIRVLIFAHDTITTAKAVISKQPKFNENSAEILETFELTHVKDVLWVAKWSPEKYSKGLFYITVITSDDHYSNQLTVPFSLDRTRFDYSLLARLILRFDFRTITMFVYSWSFFLSTLPLILLRIFTSNDEEYATYMYKLSRKRLIRKIIFRLYLLSHQSRLYYSLLFISFYSLIGPWFLAYLVADYLGIVFAWGQFILGTFLPVGFTFVFAAIYMLIVHLPFIIALSFIVYLRYLNVLKSMNNDNVNNCDGGPMRKFNERIFSKANFYALICFILIIVQFCISVIFYSAYGLLAFVSNFYVWSLFIYLSMINYSLKLDRNDFQSSKTTNNQRNNLTYQTTMNDNDPNNDDDHIATHGDSNID